MSKYRPVYTKIWKDRDFLKASKDSKLLFIYLITNESITNSGIYEIPIKTITNETGLTRSTVEQLLVKGSMKNVIYDLKNEIVFITNTRKYCRGGNPKQVEKGIINEMRQTSKTFLWNLFIQLNPCFKDIFSKVGQLLPNSSLPLPLFNNNNNSNSNSNCTKTNPKISFQEVWQSYPNKIGRKAAERHFDSSVITEQDQERITKALVNYKAHVEYQRKNGFPELMWQNGSTWFNNWPDWVEKQVEVGDPYVKERAEAKKFKEELGLV